MAQRQGQLAVDRVIHAHLIFGGFGVDETIAHIVATHHGELIFHDSVRSLDRGHAQIVGAIDQGV